VQRENAALSSADRAASRGDWARIGLGPTRHVKFDHALTDPTGLDRHPIACLQGSTFHGDFSAARRPTTPANALGGTAGTPFTAATSARGAVSMVLLRSAPVAGVSPLLEARSSTLPPVANGSVGPAAGEALAASQRASRGAFGETVPAPEKS